MIPIDTSGCKKNVFRITFCVRIINLPPIEGISSTICPDIEERKVEDKWIGKKVLVIQ